MSVQVGSKKQTYIEGLKYWELQIDRFRKAMKDNESNLDYATQGYIKLIKQYINEGFQT